MTPENAILAALEPLEGLGGKVYPLEGLKNATAPFVFYLLDAEDEEEALDGPTGLQTATYEINCVAQTYAGLLTLAVAARGALRALQGFSQDGLLIERAVVQQTSPDLKEREVGLFRRRYSLRLNYQKEETDNE